MLDIVSTNVLGNILGPGNAKKTKSLSSLFILQWKENQEIKESIMIYETSKDNFRLAMVAYTCNPSIWETDAGGFS